MLAKDKSDLQDFDAKAFEIKHSGELPLGVIPAGQTKSAASRFKIFLGVQQIGTMYQIAPDRFSTVLSYVFGGDTKEFEDPKLATDWLVDHYFDWLDGDIEILAVKLGYEICHNEIYIGFVNYSPSYGEWVAISYPDRCSCFSIAEHHGEFADAVQFIINKYLSPNSDLEPKELTTK